MTSTRYAHEARVDTAKGIYDWDCSIMTTWILDRTAPRARMALPKTGPLARDYYRAIAKVEPERPRGGWMRIGDVSHVEAGDVFAWLKPEMFKERPNTGHVGFVLEPPRPHPRFPSVWVMRVADATRELHEGDSRPTGGKGGFGTGTIAFMVDPNGAAVSYGWYGAGQDPQTFVPTRIVFGRPTG